MKPPRRVTPRRFGVLIELLTVLAGSLGLLAALHTGTLVVLTLADLGQHSGLGAAALEALQSALQRLVFSYTDFRHYISLPPARRDDPGSRKGHLYGFNSGIIFVFCPGVKGRIMNVV